jgi:hypothetical protein
MRAIRISEEPQAGFLHWLRRRWFVPLAAGGCAAIVAFFAMRPTAEPAKPIASADPLAEIVVAAAEPHDLLPSLDALLASSDNSIWLEADPSSLY